MQRAQSPKTPPQLRVWCRREALPALGAPGRGLGLHPSHLACLQPLANQPTAQQLPKLQVHGLHVFHFFSAAQAAGTWRNALFSPIGVLNAYRSRVCLNTGKEVVQGGEWGIQDTPFPEFRRQRTKLWKTHLGWQRGSFAPAKKARDGPLRLRCELQLLVNTSLEKTCAPDCVRSGVRKTCDVSGKAEVGFAVYRKDCVGILLHDRRLTSGPDYKSMMVCRTYVLII